MTILEANIPTSVVAFFKENLKNTTSMEEANNLIKERSGIHSFFSTAKHFTEFKNNIEAHTPALEEPDRRAYGDFQTNKNLANNITENLCNQGVLPEFVVESHYFPRRKKTDNKRYFDES